MIQRIQSVHLLLATLCFSLFLLLPIIKINSGAELMVEKAPENIFLLVLAVILMAGTLVNVFLYKNRVLQARVGWAMFFINILLLALLGYQFYIESRKVEDISFSSGSYFAVASLIFILLAIYRINKDEKLVRSLDRLR